MLCKLFTPWNSASYFDDASAFSAFLHRKNRRMNTERVVLFVLAFLGLMLSYATDLRIGNYVAVGALVLAVGLTLMIGKNEKLLSSGEIDK